MDDRIAKWKHLFDEDDNGISKSLSKLAWDLTAFTSLVEIVRRASTVDGEKQLNSMLLEMLVSGFWVNMMQGVRRLVDRETIHGARGVCSIAGLVADVRSVRSKVSRRVFVESIAGVDYNYAVLEAEELRFMLGHAPGQPIAFARDAAPEPSIRRHQLFDWLSGTTPGTSRPDDLIREEVFDKLEARLTALDRIVDHVNVEIAHAATEFSRSGRMLERWNLTDAKNTLKELVQIAELVGEWFCYSGVGSVLPTPQFDQFAHLDKPFFVGDTLPLQQAWDTMGEEIATWHHIDAEDL
ncbi:hypothetical protein [Pseudoxanthomonas suwonensis]|jgi:hypothetical protein|uniref:hypothetical protein n=1 Tax=Pseudoxanthomonas suwonensis TaxID=314722 RepID=UPI00138F002C|nr:hypothetical protein [Pseudoxanthomonas suwonensis]KAF1703689.1 hypothetical protein CSC68_04065 [Pseudoxanthomonas suwonensis]